MPRPTVLVATTDPSMAYVLRARLSGSCRKLGLRLDVCPDGTEDQGLGVRAYDDAEALFDYLESCKPMELADTLVVLDVGARLKEAFESKAAVDKGWHVTKNRAGVAAELILRFPQIFPVVLSPSVPADDTDGSTDKSSPDVYGVLSPRPLEEYKKARAGGWLGFTNLIGDLCNKDELPYAPPVLAFHVLLHFVSPLDRGRGLCSILARFARGMRCWFDPTGLRTLVKNRFLGTLFGSKLDWSKTAEQREVLLERLGRSAVAIDEEREFATLNAYTAYKFGRRAWVVTSYAEFDDKPLWVVQASTFGKDEEEDSDVVVLRDIDLRFPDLPDRDEYENKRKEDTGDGGAVAPLRDQLKSILSPVWTKLRDGQRRLGGKWRIRAVSSHPNTVQKTNTLWCREQKRMGELGGKYYGCAKPIASLYELGGFLGEAEGENKNNSVISRLASVQEKATGDHGAPYLNLAMAESLLQQARRCKYDPTVNLIGALLAGEAYELLLGMSNTTALEALLLQHKREVAAEVEFPGVSHNIRIDKRRCDVENTLYSLYRVDVKDGEGGGEGVGETGVRRIKMVRSKAVRDMFLSQFWAELRIVYRDGEQFGAAEAANVESLVHGRWLPSWLSPVSKAIDGAYDWSATSGLNLRGQCYSRVKKVFLWTGLPCIYHFVKVIFPKRGWVTVATSFWGWFRLWLILVIASSAYYGWLKGYTFEYSEDGIRNLVGLLYETASSSLKLELTSELKEIFKENVECTKLDFCYKKLIIFLHMAISYVLFGVFISMLYRKITRA